MAVLAALLGSASAPALASGEPWRISEATGAVSVQRPGRQEIAARPGALQPGDTVTTGEGGRAVLVRGEDYLVVAPGTRLRLPAEEVSGGVTRLVEEIGNVIYRVRRRAVQHFGVETPYLAAVVKGTTFSVTVDESGASVQVL